MPLIKLYKDVFPEWSEVKFAVIVNFNSTLKIDNQYDKMFVVVLSGKCFVENNVLINEYYLTTKKVVEFKTDDDCKILVIKGIWQEETGSFGLFKITNSDNPKNIGDPVKYKRKTDFDNHYHDCDEYWFIYGGKALCYSENKQYNVGLGDCLLTKAGEHHDIVDIKEELTGFYFETTLIGKKRKGHLWNHTHDKDAE